MQVNMIYARAANGVIGKNDTLPWHLPEDMAHFRQITMGWPVIMGRKTWDSLPPKFRPLPGRTNIVITRQADWQAEGARVAGSVEDAISLAGNVEQVWVIGGAQIYALAEPLADRIEVTEIAQDFEGDAYAPVLSTQWLASGREKHISKTGLAFSFITYNKQK
ncbi:MAG: dihydrofolate reductase [Pseudomonadota bacterium]